MISGEIHGLLVLDKPGGMTSRDALNRAQHWFPDGTKIGHTGTLDPLATGVLVICLGLATRLAEYVQAMRKTYRSTFRLGAYSETDDADGVIVPVADARQPERSEIEKSLREFIGEIDQRPPAYSAMKVTGERAYARARRGDDVVLKPRRVHVYSVEILSYSWPLLEVEVRCGKGTYIRSLARDLGEQLGCGGLVQALRRTRVGPFTFEDAVKLDADVPHVLAKLLPLAEAVTELPRVVVSAEDATRLRHGQAIRGEGAGEIAVFDEAQQLIAIGELGGGSLRPVKVFGTE